MMDASTSKTKCEHCFVVRIILQAVALNDIKLNHQVALIQDHQSYVSDTGFVTPSFELNIQLKLTSNYVIRPETLDPPKNCTITEYFQDQKIYKKKPQASAVPAYWLAVKNMKAESHLLETLNLISQQRMILCLFQPY